MRFFAPLKVRFPDYMATFEGAERCTSKRIYRFCDFNMSEAHAARGHDPLLQIDISWEVFPPFFETKNKSLTFDLHSNEIKGLINDLTKILKALDKADA